MGQVDEHAVAVYGVPKLEESQGEGDGFVEWCRTAGEALAQRIANTVSRCGDIGLWLADPVAPGVPHAILTDLSCVKALHEEYTAAHALGECLASSGDPAATSVREGVRRMWSALGVAHTAGAPNP